MRQVQFPDTVLVPISEGIPQDVLQSFGVQESQEDIQPLHLAPSWEQVIPLFSGELRNFFLTDLGGLDWSSREGNLFWMPGGKLGLWICNPPKGQLDR